MRSEGSPDCLVPKNSPGLPSLRIANILRDPDILTHARHEARAFVEHPPSQEDFAKAIAYIKGHWQRRYGLVQVG